ncbi:hypothetical protein MTR_7g446060 [Medicago truncatula]|uniref:Protein FAR1-RELATED SEQUENCE n=1 Tax=Medicago truncatula TaxID=3880 RepID=A0A072U9A2_MEDTR|nr:hypothetical protein MTR_7g446060 [Medicago truncatula]
MCLSLDGKITITNVTLEHNHELSPTESRYFRCNKNLDPHTKRRLDINDQADINVSRNFRSMVVEANEYDNLTFEEKDRRNYIDKVRRLRLGIVKVWKLRLCSVFKNLSLEMASCYLREEQDLSKHEVGQFRQSSSLG